MWSFDIFYGNYRQKKQPKKYFVFFYVTAKLAISKCNEKIKSLSEKSKNANEELDKRVSLLKKTTTNKPSVLNHFNCNVYEHVIVSAFGYIWAAWESVDKYGLCLFRKKTCSMLVYNVWVETKNTLIQDLSSK